MLQKWENAHRSFVKDSRARDYKEISSMSRCSTHDSVLQFNPKIENSEVVTINKLVSVFCAQFEFRTQTEVSKSQTERIGDYKGFGVQKCTQLRAQIEKFEVSVLP